MYLTFPGAGRAHAYVVAASCLISVFHFVLSGTAFSFFFLEHTAYALFFFSLPSVLNCTPPFICCCCYFFAIAFFFLLAFFFFSPFSQSFLHLLFADGKFKESTNNNSNKALRRENRRGFSYLQMRTFVIQAAGCVVHFFFFGMCSLLFTICCRKARQRLRRKRTWKGDRLFSPIFA